MSSLGNRISRLMLWVYRLDEQLPDGESLIYDTPGSFMGRFAGLKGRIILTNRRLIFRSNSMRPGLTDQVQIALNLHEILSVTLNDRWDARDPFSVGGVEIELSGETVQFRILTPRAFLEQLQNTLSEHAR